MSPLQFLEFCFFSGSTQCCKKWTVKLSSSSLDSGNTELICYKLSCICAQRLSLIMTLIMTVITNPQLNSYPLHFTRQQTARHMRWNCSLVQVGLFICLKISTCLSALLDQGQSILQVSRWLLYLYSSFPEWTFRFAVGGKKK